MKATDLQIRLAHLAPGEMLLLPVAEVDETFYAYPIFAEHRIAALALAVLYRCTLTVRGPGRKPSPLHPA